MDPNRIAAFILSMLPFLLAITVHEVAHGYIAYRKGDYTAKLMGRLTMNPIKHLDPVGSVLFPLILLVSGAGVIFGWAKPVPVSPVNFKSPRKDMMHVSLAGPLSNFLLAFALAFVLKILFWFPGPAAIGSSQVLGPLVRMVAIGINISVYLGVFNLLPVHPLDGSHIMEGLLPPKQARVFSRMAPYGWIILMVLLFSGFFRVLINPVYRVIMGAISGIFGF